MASILIKDVFLKCKKCGTVNRIVAVGLAEGQNVNCSQCGTLMGSWGKLKLIASSCDAGAIRFRAGKAQGVSKSG